MRIKVDRTNNDSGNLVFTITISEPHNAPFTDIDKEIVDALDACRENLNKISSSENKLKEHVINLMNKAEATAFSRVLNSLQDAIKNQFKPKYEHICQEIYNWIYDNQKEPLKSWMLEFDPQRTKYYFDNDITAESNCIPQESEHEVEDDEDGWEED